MSFYDDLTKLHRGDQAYTFEVDEDGFQRIMCGIEIILTDNYARPYELQRIVDCLNACRNISTEDLRVSRIMVCSSD